MLNSVVKSLVVTEKFNTALRIAVVLSDGKMRREKRGSVAVFHFERPDGEYTVLGLRGHIVELDYPEEFRSWSLEALPRLIEAPPMRSVTEPTIVSILQELAPQFDQVVLATDWDREGEVIAAECLEILHEVNPQLQVSRAQYSALTRSEIERAFGSLKELDRNLASAGVARQNVDLMWGALLTRYLTLISREGPGRAAGPSSSGFLSVGRVQTPTLALLVGRDREIREFVPRPFWNVFAELHREGTAFRADHSHGRYFERSEVDIVLARLEGIREAEVKEFRQEATRQRPPVPFNTTLFVSEATKLGFGASQAMRIAEDLYTEGLISYPRTDNTVYPSSLRLRTVLEGLSEGPFGEAAKALLAQEKLRATRGRSETTDHPPIYPTGSADPKRLRGDRAQIYELVVRRFLATVAPDAELTTRHADLDLRGEIFGAEGSHLDFPGWYLYYPYATPPRDVELPVLSLGEHLPVDRVGVTEDKTQPPRRFGQGSLIQEMERLGLGTKSTRHDILQKLLDRHYVQARGLEPTASGVAVTEALQANAPVVTLPDMTSQLERDMDDIAQGKKSLGDVVGESREMLREIYGVLRENSAAVRDTLVNALDRQHFLGPCPKCSGALRLMRSQRGSRWAQCVNNPRSCTVSFPLPSAGFLEPLHEVCPVCHVPLVRMTYRGQRPQTYCINPDCEEHKKAYRIGLCPSCGSPLHVRYSQKGNRFVGCTAYPRCRVTYPLPQRGHLERDHPPCEQCRAPVVTVIERGRPPWTLCINPECPTRKGASPTPTPARARAEGSAPTRSRAAPRARATARKKVASQEPPTEGEVTPEPPTKPRVRRTARA